MKENVRFYRCPICGNIIGLIDGDMSRVICCGRPMEEMVANTTDAAVEKHLPQVEVLNNYIVVTVNHVMEDDHYIEWVALSSDKVLGKKFLKPGEQAKVVFPYIKGSEVHAYCNKHGVWKTDVK